MAVFNGPASAIEDNRNKITDITEDCTNEQYPSALAVKKYVDNLIGSGGVVLPNAEEVAF